MDLNKELKNLSTHYNIFKISQKGITFIGFKNIFETAREVIVTG